MPQGPAPEGPARAAAGFAGLPSKNDDGEWLAVIEASQGSANKLKYDIERGVFKAPANEVVRGALDLEFAINESAQDLLNPRGVNAIRNFPGCGDIT